MNDYTSADIMLNIFTEAHVNGNSLNFLKKHFLCLHSHLKINSRRIYVNEGVMSLTKKLLR